MEGRVGGQGRKHTEELPRAGSDNKKESSSSDLRPLRLELEQAREQSLLCLLLR